MQASNSEVKTWKRCRRKWYLNYYRELAPNGEPAYGAAALGRSVHAALQVYYQEGFDPEAALRVHQALLARDLEAYPDQTEAIMKDGELAHIMLAGYFDWLEETAADEGIEVVGAEHEVSAEVTTPKGVPVKIRGKLDLRVKQDGVTTFLDHKTVQEFTTPTKTLHLDEQMLMYHLLLALDTEGAERVDGGTYNMLRKVKRTARSNPPFYQRFVVRHNREEVQTFYLRLLAALEDISDARERLDSGESPTHVCYPSPTRDCSWDCPYYALCPIMNRPAENPESFIRLAFTHSDPYERYGGNEGKGS